MIGVAAEYEALRRHAAVIDRSDRGRIRFSGTKAADVLNGLLTNDIAVLRAGSGAYAAALTAKGKIVADLRVLVFEDSILTDCAAVAWEGWWTVVRKYVNPRLSVYADERALQHDLGVFGPEAPVVVATLTGVDAGQLTALEPYGHLRIEVEGTPVTIARVPDLVPDGYELLASPDTIAQLHERARRSGIVTASPEAWEIARVESGRPSWGMDIDESTLPQEANFDELGAISYTKGCYTGQEVVARVHFRGHVNKRLMGLRASIAEPPASGARLMDADGKQVGDVRSAVTSPRLGGIALGMVRREIEAGAELTARWSDGECALQVVSLPFTG